MNGHVAAVEVTDAEIAEVLTDAHAILTRRGIARNRSVLEVPGRPFEDCPICLNAAISRAVDHGPYGGCFVVACTGCARAEAARILLARRLLDPPPRNLDAAFAFGILQVWNDDSRGVTDEQILAEVAAAAAAAAELAGGAAC